jgi:hypothetical protein
MRSTARLTSLFHATHDEKQHEPASADLSHDLWKLVLSYYLTTLDDVHIANHYFGKTVMQPFNQALNHFIYPFLADNPKIKNFLYQGNNSSAHENTNSIEKQIIDSILHDIKHTPLELKINLLADSLNEKWDSLDAPSIATDADEKTPLINRDQAHYLRNSQLKNAFDKFKALLTESSAVKHYLPPGSKSLLRTLLTGDSMWPAKKLMADYMQEKLIESLNLLIEQTLAKAYRDTQEKLSVSDYSIPIRQHRDHPEEKQSGVPLLNHQNISLQREALLQQLYEKSAGFFSIPVPNLTWQLPPFFSHGRIGVSSISSLALSSISLFIDRRLSMLFMLPMLAELGYIYWQSVRLSRLAEQHIFLHHISQNDAFTNEPAIEMPFEIHPDDLVDEADEKKQLSP